MSNKVPCCWGCMMWGHARGCDCPSPEDWPVTIRYADAEAIAEGTVSEPVRKRVTAAVNRVMHARFGLDR